MTKTEPTPSHDARNTAPLLAIDATYRDPVTHALYVHEDLKQVQGPWETEAHIAPFAADEKFGDVESFAHFVQRFSADPPLLTWSEQGLRAVLDFGTTDNPGRRLVKASHPFERSLQWRAWQALADGKPRTQRQTIEALEDLSEDIVDPDAATLVGLLRVLRATANATAETELRPDGTSRVRFEKSSKVEGETVLPSEIVIAIPVLKGHAEDGVEGKTVPVLYRLPVRVRVGVNVDAHLTFRLSMPTAERILEAVFADRVEAAAELLGDGFTLLRATGA